jgi:hypothetical protein
LINVIGNGHECLQGVSAALAQKDEAIAEIEGTIKAVTADLTYNVGLVQQRVLMKSVD